MKIVASKTFCQQQVVAVDGPHPGYYIDADGEKRSQEYDHHFRYQPDPEPEHYQGQQGDARSDVEHGDERIENVVQPPVPTGKQTQWNGQKNRQEKTEKEFFPAGGQVLEYLSRPDHFKGRQRDRAGRTQEDRADLAATADCFPYCQKEHHCDGAQDHTLVSRVKATRMDLNTNSGLSRMSVRRCIAASFTVY